MLWHWSQKPLSKIFMKKFSLLLQWVNWGSGKENAGSLVCKWQGRDSNPGSWHQASICFFSSLWLSSCRHTTALEEPKLQTWDVEVNLSNDSGDMLDWDGARQHALGFPQWPGDWRKRVSNIRGPCPLHEIKSKLIIDLNVKLKTIKLRRKHRRASS